jgi:hypothetical protein
MDEPYGRFGRAPSAGIKDARAALSNQMSRTPETTESTDFFLEYAISTRQGDGVWGGLTAVERHRLLRRRQKVAREESRQTSAA